MRSKARRNRCAGGAPSRTAGFSLVEMMIVVAVLAVLAAIAIPNYQSHREKARITAMVSEISGGRVGLELLMLSATGTPIIDPQAVGLHASTSLCPTVRVNIVPSSRKGFLVCEGDFFNSVDLTYLPDGTWDCIVVTYRARPRNNWAPSGCRNLFAGT
ncbi:TPA: pilin [Stenotrophomonas maltophilia]|nr:pilin [Stenotrophomonas maltophilia]HDS1024029.1 pilin [Stenotrophomonas maltophilia]HDS1029311.1 pilin [Stenotrophomonas maltophilia]HDS1032792.1 pilin [Stenotrophomonas maltophilia]